MALTLILIALLVVSHRQDHGHHDRSPSVSIPMPSMPSTGRSANGLPSMDLFGNRLDPAGNEAGAALAQDAGRRPDPHAPDYLSITPSGMVWQRGWGGAALGVSRSDGPSRIDGGIASGYADTPQGAGLAAYDALGRALAAPDGVWQQVIAQRYVDGGQALASRFGRSHATTPDMAKYVVVPDGIRVMPGYRPDFAVVQIAIRGKDGWGCSTWPMVWTNGDWKVRTPENPDDLWASQPLDSLTGFGVWK
ncbi:hypothetical protein [Nocardia terpenica]|nr:hypothetical protein [Nocardia terpenica]NQE85948.1 hypothetical protein [Nocardia terpenica]